MRCLKVALIVIVATALYLILAISTVNYAFGVMPALDSAEATFGRLAGTRIWSHSPHAAGVLVAAIPSALLLSIADRSHALRLAATTGVLTSVAALVPSFLHPDVRPFLDTHFYVTAAIDSQKLVLILMLPTWLFSKLLSYYAMQRSAHVGTPLAGTAIDSKMLRSASGAPTARRR